MSYTEQTDTEIAEMIGAGDAPCCPWGTSDRDWTPAAIGLARLYAEQDGRPVDQDTADYAAGAIVNCGDSEAWELHESYPEHVHRPRLQWPQVCGGTGDHSRQDCDDCDECNPEL